MQDNDQQLRYQLNALTEVAKTLTQPLELSELLEAVLRKISAVIEPAEIGLVMLWDQSAGLFRPVAALGFDSRIIRELGLRAGESITGKVHDKGCAQLLRTHEEVSSFMDDMRPANRAVYTRALGDHRLPVSTLAAPITVANQKFGVLLLGTVYRPGVFSEQDLPFIQSLADLIGLAIDRARMEERADFIRQESEADRMRSEIMAVLSHELRLPLTAIMGYSTALLLDDAEISEEKKHRYLMNIDEECYNMGVMLRNILDSSLIDVNELKIEPEPMRLQHIAHDIAIEIQRHTENHRIVVDFPAGFPILEADPRWIKQVFRNILDNAIKYSPDGGLIVIQAEVRPQDIVVTVSDQGIGISPEDLIPLFEKFYRVRGSNHIHVSGTGLGLPIARSIVEVHGGRIWAESKIGEGTTLHFSLPLPARQQGDED